MINLVPIQHLPSTVSLSKPALEEMILWKGAFISFFESKNQNVVFCEHNQPGHNPDLQHLIYQGKILWFIFLFLYCDGFVILINLLKNFQSFILFFPLIEISRWSPKECSYEAPF